LPVVNRSKTDVGVAAWARSDLTTLTHLWPPRLFSRQAIPDVPFWRPVPGAQRAGDRMWPSFGPSARPAGRRPGPRRSSVFGVPRVHSA